MFEGESAKTYDQRFEKLGSIKETLNLVCGIALRDLVENAKILIVGAGTGSELRTLAKMFPLWRFVCFEPSKDMFDQLKAAIEQDGIVERCECFNSYLKDEKSLPIFDGAIALLVSHFCLNKVERQEFFDEIFSRLRNGAKFVNGELCADISAPDYNRNLELWRSMFLVGGFQNDAIDKTVFDEMGKSYIIESPQMLENYLKKAGFEDPLLYFKNILMHLWVSTK